MSFYVKLFLVIVSGTIVSFIVVKTLVVSTDHMPNTFNTTTTSYMQRDADADAAKKAAAKAKPVAVREKSDLEKEIEKERGANAKAALERKELRMANEENSLRKNTRASYTADEDSLPPLPIAVAKNDTEDEQTAAKDQSDDSGSQASDSASTAEQTRSDSDADIKAQIVSKKPDNAAIKPNDIKTRISKSSSEILKKTKRAETVQALDLAYAPPAKSTCTFPENNVVRVGVSYRKSSYAIKGQSLTNIDQLVKLYNKCGGGKMLVLENVEGIEDTEERLIQLRKDEVKYYLLQRRVPKDDMIFSDNS